MDKSPRSALTPPSALEENFETVDTNDISNWLISIEKCLHKVCSIAQEGKLNSDQKLKISSLTRNIGHSVSQMAVYYQDLKLKAKEVGSSVRAIREKYDLTNCLENFQHSIQTRIQENWTKPTKAEKVSFADMVKTNKNNFLRPNNFSSIAIYPTD
ncbi:hypothetical protein PYW07_011412 [Mythimna separata]|uniref:Uncharacterized protein n=1 Tax=Mythimna separata TaxID=271217 RepID=A0AAD7Y9K1_MYTSE|nr:hypothetical protein PYW07_011412 [Mythimna separata]